MDDLVRRIARLEDDTKEARSDLKVIRNDLTELKVQLAKMDGRLSGIDGRLDGLDKRFNHVPTALQLLGALVAIIVAAGIFRWIDRSQVPAMPTPAVTAPR